MTINSFSGDYSFLSNFHLCKISYEGKEYPSSEHAFQAAKTTNEAEREKIRLAKRPGSAKALGKKVSLRKDWNFLRADFMKKVLQIKFSDPELQALLLATGEEQLIEGNTWGDTFWGVCHGKGENRLGKLLMQIRSDLRKV
jgi:hypothetical protein